MSKKHDPKPDVEAMPEMSMSAMVPLGQVLTEAAKTQDGYLEIQFDNKLFRIMYVANLISTHPTLKDDE